jgi:hypothetical protein
MDTFPVMNESRPAWAGGSSCAEIDVEARIRKAAAAMASRALLKDAGANKCIRSSFRRAIILHTNPVLFEKFWNKVVFCHSILGTIFWMQAYKRMRGDCHGEERDAGSGSNDCGLWRWPPVWRDA